MDQDPYPEDVLRPFLAYIGEVRDALRMQNWDIILHAEKDEDEDTNASTWQQYNYTVLNIRLGRTLFDLTPVQIRNTIIHELIHAQHRDVSMLWEACTQENSDVPASRAKSWDADFHVYMERFVAWITDRISRDDFIPYYNPKKPPRTPAGCYLFGENPA